MSRIFWIIAGLICCSASALAVEERNCEETTYPVDYDSEYHDAICKKYSTAIVLDSAERLINLCKGSKLEVSFLVALGSGGLGKKKQGDQKTPLGVYSLGEMRPSDQYGYFIPIGYPNVQDRARGYTGGSVGIHGPDRGRYCYGQRNIIKNWTNGCIALSSEEEVKTIFRFMKGNRVKKIVILGSETD